MKIKLEKEENVIVVLCERKKANLKIIYKDIATDEIIGEEFIDNLQIGEEVEVEPNPPQNYNIVNDEDKEEVEDAYDSILKEMKEFRRELGE